MQPRIMDPLVYDALLIIEQGPDDPGYDAAWRYLMRCSEPAVQALLRQALEAEFGPMPLATGYDDAGQPFWTTATIAAYLEVPLGEVEAIAGEACGPASPWGQGVCATTRLHSVH
ncbi:MAG: hypothetical protein HQL82_09825 [Magnetococcales bacterium]|nr:hypothetical protein [Magnetococcales bacterium]